MRNNSCMPAGISALITPVIATCLFFPVLFFLASCHKQVVDAETRGPDGDETQNVSILAAPTGNPTIDVFPVRAPHNTGYDVATDCAPSSWNCGSAHSNSDWFISSNDAHYGIDIWAALGAPVVAPVTGTLAVVVNTIDNGLGRHVYIRQSNGWHHVLGHLNSLATGLAVGQTVYAGQSIGTVGSTGTNSGRVVHLHYSVNHGPGYWTTGINFYSLLVAKEVNVCTMPGTTTTLTPVADAYVRDGTYADQNFGTADGMVVKSGAVNFSRRAYMKFDCSAITNVITAKIRVYGGNVESTGGAGTRILSSNIDTWTETGITWNNSPGRNYIGFGTVTTTKYYEWDVTSFVRSQVSGDKIVTLCLEQAASVNLTTTWNSRESAANKPQLVILQ